jgi:hypothetical protein
MTPAMPKATRIKFISRLRRRRKDRFCNPTGKYKGDRLILGFYYYLHEDEVGDRSKGWRMFARNK